jgi:formylglycine-generating enzyme required for sulfatase activity
MKYLLLAMLFSLLMAGCGEEAKKEAVYEDAVQKDETKDDNTVQKDETKDDNTVQKDETKDDNTVQKDETKDDNAAPLGDNFTVPEFNLDMIWLKPGTFMMGSPVSERGLDEIQHQVTLTQGFYLGKYEVTQAQWERVMGNNPSHFKGANRPVEQVSWNDAVDFCKKLTEMEKKAGRVPEGMSYQLPTEAQWEYACRAGTTTAFSWGNDINPTRANYYFANIGQTSNVGNYAANL